MMHSEWLAWWLVGLIAFGVLAALAFQVSRPARLRRRRRKSHSRIVSKSKQPAVRLSVRPPKE